MAIEPTLLAHAGLAGFLCAAYQLRRHVVSHDALNVGALCVNVVIGAVLGAAAGHYLGRAFPNWSLLGVALAGFWSVPLITFAEKHWSTVAARRLGIAVDARQGEGRRESIAMFDTQELSNIVRRRRADKKDAPPNDYP